MKRIPLSKGLFALVDDKDFNILSDFKWYAKTKKFYTAYAVSSPIRGEKTMVMHREIMGVYDPSILVDHRDGNGLNNQRYNLRVCTPSQNLMNRKSNENSTSKYLGVCKMFIKKDNTYHWRAQIRINKINVYLGRFPFTEEGEIQAAKTRDTAAIIHHGEFARLNFETKNP